MYNVFYVESPLQLLSAISAKSISEESSILILNISDGKRSTNNKQILALLNETDWAKVYIQKKHSGKFLYNFHSFFRTIMYFFKFKNKINKFYFGEYRNFDMISFGGVVNAKEAILLDDGSFTITAQKHYISKGILPIPLDGSITKLKLFLYKVLCGWSLNDIQPPNLYSFFDLSQYMVDNQINYFKPSSLKKITLDENIVFYFGSKLSESNYLDISSELKVLKKVFRKYEDKIVYYIPHRDETTSKLTAIESMGFTLKTLGVPAEVFFDQTDVMPSIVISTYSTTLYSCFIRFKDIKIITVDVRPYIINAEAKVNADNIYPYYDDLGILVENFSSDD